MVKRLRNCFLFGFGVGIGLIIEFYIHQESTMILFGFASLMLLCVLLCAIPELKTWLFVFKQNYVIYVLRVENIDGLDHFFARDMQGEFLYDIQCSTKDYKRPPYDVGTVVYVRGKRGCKRKEAYQLLVDCFVTIP